MALLALVGWKSQSFAIVALACNLVVTGQGAWILGYNGYLKWKNAIPFLVASIPMALLGGLFKISQSLWLIILGISLLCSGLAILLPKTGEGESLDRINRK